MSVAAPHGLRVLAITRDAARGAAIVAALRTSEVLGEAPARVAPTARLALLAPAGRFVHWPPKLGAMIADSASAGEVADALERLALGAPFRPPVRRKPGDARRNRRRATEQAMDDAGHLMALEAFLFAAVFLGAVAYMGTLDPGAAEGGDPIEFIAADALASLAETPASDGQPLLDPLVAHAARCAADAAPQDCLADGPAAVRSRLRAYLPSGTGYVLELSNGARRIPLTPAAEWEGPSVASSIPYAPQSKYGLVSPVLSCSAADAPLRAEAVFVRNGNVRLPRSVAFDTGGASVPASPAGDVWRADVAPSAGATTLTARSTSIHGETTAVASVATCALGETQVALLASLETTSIGFAAATPGGTMHPGSDIVVSRDLSALAQVPGVTLLGATLEIHSPLIAGRPMWTLPWDATPSGEETWRIPTAALHGCHPIVLRATLAVAVDGGLDVEARRLGTLCVTLPGGELPPEPTYRVSIRAWQEGGRG